MISESVKNQLNEHGSHQPVEIKQAIPQHTPEKSDHVIVVHGEVGDANFDGFNDNKWNTIVKRNLSSKLKSIPIKNSLKTKDLRSPQRLLFVENEETMNQIRGSVKR